MRPWTMFPLVLVVACGGGGSNPLGDAAGGTDGPGAVKHVFVTSADFPGGFGSAFGTDGPDMADAQCQTAAQGAGLGGTWKAWLSHRGVGDFLARTAPERITGAGPWHLTGTEMLVFLNRSALANTPRVPIDHNEYGIQVSSGPVWTGTAAGGARGAWDCELWTASGSSRSGTVGQLSATTSEWTDIGASQLCNTRARLYCLEM